MQPTTKSIYDRSIWPSPEANPIVLLLRRGDDWYSNEELVAALGLSKGRALLANGTIFRAQIADEDTGIVSRGSLILGKSVRAAHSGAQRVFSRRAVVIAAMRTETHYAAAFRDWVAGEIATENGGSD